MLLIHGCGGTIGGSPGIFGSGNKKTDTNETEMPGEQPTPIPMPATGLTFSLSNIPMEGAKNVYLRITTLEITSKDGSLLSVPLASTNEIDVLPLQDGKSQVLGSLADLPPGEYSQTRLQLASDPAGRLIDASGVEYPLTIPAGSETGLTIASSFSKVEGVALSLTLNFNLQQSIDAVDGEGGSRRYVLKPVIRLSDDSKTGTISGRGPDGAVVCAYTEGTYQPDDDDDDDDCEGSFSSTLVKSGLFTLPFLDPGRYDLRFIRGETLVGEAKAVEVQSGKNNSSVNVP
jgi:hypothetical protein